jgi:H/ACA ribonucleoprotein complex subunit 4
MFLSQRLRYLNEGFLFDFMDELLNFGLINIDKPSGPTSFSVSEFVKRELKLKKTSHMGTLDPKVTGVLPITLGRACKLARYFISHDKTYVGVLCTHKDCKIEELQKLIDENFMGKIEQTPPHRSAVKRAPRIREVFFWNLMEASDDGKNFLFECKVEGGTYIRKLCSDLGDMIGGAHMGELRRTQAGDFNESKMYTLNEFEVAVEKYNAGEVDELYEMIVPAGEAIRKVLPYVEIDKSCLKRLYDGKPLFESYIVGDIPKFKKGGGFSAFCNGDFVGVYKRVVQNARGRKEGVIYPFAKVEFVKN